MSERVDKYRKRVAEQKNKVATKDNEIDVTETVNVITQKRDVAKEKEVVTKKDIDKLHNAMESVLDSSSKKTGVKINRELADINHNMEVAFSEHTESHMSDMGSALADTIKETISKIADTDNIWSRQQIKSFDTQMDLIDKRIKTIIEDPDPTNDEEIEYLNELVDLAHKSVKQKEVDTLGIKAYIDKEFNRARMMERTIDASVTAVEKGMGEVENAITDVTDSPLVKHGLDMLSGMFSGVTDKAKEALQFKQFLDQQVREEEANTHLSAIEKLQNERLHHDKEALKLQNDIDNTLSGIDNDNQYQNDIEVVPPDIEVEQPDINVEQPDIAVDQPDINVDQPDIAVEQPDIIIESPIINIEAPAQQENIVPAQHMKPDVAPLIVPDNTGDVQDSKPVFITKDEVEEQVLNKLIEINRNIESSFMGDSEEKMEQTHQQEELIDAVDGVADAIGAKLSTKEKNGWFSNILEGLLPQFLIGGSLLASMKKMILSPFTMIGNMVKGIGKIGIFAKIGNIGKMLATPLKFISKLGVLARVFGKTIPVVGWVITLFEGITGFFNASDVLGKENVTIMDRVGAGIGSIFEGFAEIGDMIAGWFGFDTDMKGWLNENFTRPFAELLNMDFSEIWSNTTEYFTNIFGNIVTNTKEFFGNIFSWENIKEGLQTAWQWNPFNIMSDFIASAGNYLLEKMDWKNISDKLIKFSPVGLIMDFAKNVTAWIKDKLNIFGLGKKDKDPIAQDVKKPEKDFVTDVLTEKGVVQHKGIGRDSKITDWNAVEKMTSSDIGKLIAFDDFSTDTMKQLSNLEASKRKLEMLKTDKYEQNTTRPYQIAESKEIIENNKLEATSNAIIADNSTRQVINNTSNQTVTVPATPRDTDPHIMYMNQVFAP